MRRKNKNYIGILAPVKDPLYSHLRFDFTAKLGGKELTLEYLNSLFMYCYRIDDIPVRKKEDLYTATGAGMYLTGYLRSIGYDTFLVSTADDKALMEFANKDVFAICISTTLIMYQSTFIDLVKKLKNICPQAKIIIGGIWLWKSYLWHQKSNGFKDDKYPQLLDFSFAYKTLPADVFVFSPLGVSLLKPILKYLKTGNTSKLSEIPNLGLFNKKGQFYFTQRMNEKIDYDAMITRWDLIDTIPKKIPVHSSYGCPYKCHYCDYHIIYPQVHLRSMDSLKQELKLLRGKIKNSSLNHSIDFTDDNTFFTSSRVKEFCQVLIESEINLPWISPMVPSSITEDNIDLLKKSRMQNAFIGLESGDKEQIKRMHKQQDLEKMKLGIELLDKAGIHKIIGVIAGYPGETEKTLLNTAFFLNDLNLHFAEYVIYPLYVLHLSPLSGKEMRLKWDLKGIYDSWEHKTMSSREVIKAGYTIFKTVTSIPYYYRNKNPHFWLYFCPQGKKQLFRLRHRLTCQILEKVNWSSIADTFSLLAREMDYKDSFPPLKVKEYIAPEPFKEV